MENFVTMALLDSIQQLVHKFLLKKVLDRVTCTYLHLDVFELSTGVKQLLKVLVKVLEDQGKLLVSVEHVLKSHYVWVLQFLQQSDLPDGGGGDAFLFTLESDFLKSIDFASLIVSCLVDDSISALTDEVKLFISLDSWLHPNESYYL